MAIVKRTFIFPIVVLTTLALLTAAGLSSLSARTAHKISANQRAWEMRQISELLSTTDYDNDVFSDVVIVNATDPDAQLLGPGTRHQILRATRNGQPRAAIFQSTAANGYSGPIELLVAIYTDGSVAGVRTVRHRETPGLGDRIDISRSRWITTFDGRSLADPTVDDWTIRRDSGTFDQITGASVTSRAVTSAVRDALRYFAVHEATVFSATASSRGHSQ